METRLQRIVFEFARFGQQLVRLGQAIFVHAQQGQLEERVRHQVLVVCQRRFAANEQCMRNSRNLEDF